MRTKKQVGIALGILVVLGVLVWGLLFGGFSTGTPVQPNGGSNSTNQTELTGRTTLGTGKIKVNNYTVGVTVTSSIVVENGKNTTVAYTISCRQPDNALAGYIKAPTNAIDWFQITEKYPTLESGETGKFHITMLVPADITGEELVVYYLTSEGKQYLNAARDSTLSSEDALAVAFKKELIDFIDIQEQFDTLYANRGDKYVFKVIYDAFPRHYPELVEAWERAIDAVAADLSAIPYASALATLERLGSVSEVDRGNYPELSSLPAQYAASADLREQPWEVWITVMEQGQDSVQVELACRWLVSMA